MAKSGGAYLPFGEFLKSKSDSEMSKIDELIQKKEWDQEALASYYLEDINSDSAKKRTVGRKSPNREGPEPRRTSPKPARMSPKAERSYQSGTDKFSTAARMSPNHNKAPAKLF